MGKITEARHPGARIVPLRVFNLVPYPSVIPSAGDFGQIRARLSALTLKTMAIHTPLILEKFGAIRRTLKK